MLASHLSKLEHLALHIGPNDRKHVIWSDYYLLIGQNGKGKLQSLPENAGPPLVIGKPSYFLRSEKRIRTNVMGWW